MRNGIIVISCIMYIFFCGGCATHITGTPYPEPRPLGSELGVRTVPPLSPEEAMVIQPGENPGGEINLHKALSLVLLQNPELQAFSLEVRAREAQALQQGIPSNPELEFEIGEFGGTGEKKGIESAEFSVALSQLIELGGKRIKRTRIAELDTRLAGWDYEKKRIGILTETVKRFVEVLTYQNQVLLSEELVRLAEKTHTTISERVNAGKVSPVEETRSRIELATTRLGAKRTREALETSRTELAGMWGAAVPEFQQVTGDLEKIESVEFEQKYDQYLELNPDFAQIKIEKEQLRQILELEKTKTVPDITISGGVARFQESEDTAFHVGISIPVPLLDKNRGGILEAGYRLAKAEQKQAAVITALKTAVLKTMRNLSLAYAEVFTYRQEIIPDAKNAFESVREGYLQGKFNYLHLVEAQRTLFSVQNEYFTALASYHFARADLEQLFGMSVHEMNGTESIAEKRSSHEE